MDYSKVKQIVNLTNYNMVLYTKDGEALRLPASLKVPFIKGHQEQIGEFKTIPIAVTPVDSIDNLPEFNEEKMYIVPLEVRKSLPKRKDLCSPGSITIIDHRYVQIKTLIVNNP